MSWIAVEERVLFAHEVIANSRSRVQGYFCRTTVLHYFPPSELPTSLQRATQQASLLSDWFSLSRLAKNALIQHHTGYLRGYHTHLLT